MGITANALVAWRVPPGRGDEAGKRLAAFPGVTHCYERGAVPGRWDYTHYTVHHGRSRDDVTAEVKRCAEMTELDEYTVIFSTEELKRVPAARVSENGGELSMNRITQCMHGRGTVSGVMHHRHAPQEDVPSKYLAYAGLHRPVVFWNLTDRCNLACTHCYSSSGPGRDTSKELSTAEALALIDDFSVMGVPLILFSGGEPLLRDDIWELACHARKKGIKMALSTNGTLITEDIARKIKESGIEYAGISLDGATPEPTTGSGIPRARSNARSLHSPGAVMLASGAGSGSP